MTQVAQAAISDVKTRILFPAFAEEEFNKTHFLTAKTIRAFAPDLGAYPQAKINSIGNAGAQGLPHATSQVLVPEGWMAEIPVNYAFPRPEDISFWCGLAMGKVVNTNRVKIDGTWYYLHTLQTNNDNDLRLLSSALTFIYENPPSSFDDDNIGLVERWDGVVMDRFSLGCEIGESQIATFQGQAYSSGSFSLPQREFTSNSSNWDSDQRINKAGGYPIGSKTMILDDVANLGVGDVFTTNTPGQHAEIKISSIDTVAKTITFSPGLAVAESDNEVLSYVRTAGTAFKKLTVSGLGNFGTVRVNKAGNVALGSTTITYDGGGSPKVGDVFTVTGNSQEYCITKVTDTVITFTPGLVAVANDNATLVWVRNDGDAGNGDYFYVDHMDKDTIEGEALSGSSMGVFLAHRSRDDVNAGVNTLRRFPVAARESSGRNVAMNPAVSNLTGFANITEDLFSWRLNYSNNINMAANRRFGNKRMSRGHRGNPFYTITLELMFERKRGLHRYVAEIIEKAKAGDQFAIQIVMTNAKLSSTQWKGILITIPAMQIQDHSRGATNNQLNTTLMFEPVTLEDDTDPIYIDVVDGIKGYHQDIESLDSTTKGKFATRPGQDSE